MATRESAQALKTLLSGIEASATLKAVGEHIDRFSASAAYQILHLGVCKIDDVIVKDIVYSRPLEGSTLSVADFSEDLKLIVIVEALHLMRPFDLLRHEFETADSGLFAELRRMLAGEGVDGVQVIPYAHQGTITIILINCPYKEFIANQPDILPAIYQLAAKIFARFPALTKWPGEFRLTAREAEILQLTAEGRQESAIASLLGISPNTVRNHIENSKRKLDARNKAHAISLAAIGGEINPLADRRR